MYGLFQSLSDSVPYISSNPEPLALCPCPPENSDTATSSDDELDGGICSFCGSEVAKYEVDDCDGVCFDCFGYADDRGE